MTDLCKSPIPPHAHHTIPHHTILYHTTWLGTVVWNGIVWYGVVWHVVWCDEWLRRINSTKDFALPDPSILYHSIPPYPTMWYGIVYVRNIARAHGAHRLGPGPCYGHGLMSRAQAHNLGLGHRAYNIYHHNIYHICHHKYHS